MLAGWRSGLSLYFNLSAKRLGTGAPLSRFCQLDQLLNCFSSNCAVSSKSFALSRRQGIGAGQLFKKLDHLAVPR
jgi:hypothetical protein